jgi:hypothetical protein
MPELRGAARRIIARRNACQIVAADWLDKTNLSLPNPRSENDTTYLS